MPEGGKFFNELDIKKEAKKWQKQAKKKEARNPEINSHRIYHYRTSRIDTEEEFSIDSIESMHGISFLSEVIPTLISNNPGRKIKILDVGAGMTMFTNQIRDRYGDKVQVLSTGLSKKAFRAELKENLNKHYGLRKDYPDSLHPDDLKWRSIRELSNFEEFDLIVDTFGEFAYSRDNNMLIGNTTPDNLPRVFEYISMIAAKLRSGGLASLMPIIFGSRDHEDEFNKWLRQAHDDLGVSFDLERVEDAGAYQSKSYALRVRKPRRKENKEDPKNEE